ncbi:elongator complex protein 3 [Thermodesulfobacteriota bacterium]
MPENPENPVSKPRPFIIPIFLPHAGCPHQCAFCNQSAITRVKQPFFSPEKLGKRINEFLGYKGKERRPIQIAFYGGNFLGQEESYLLSLLEAATKFIDAGKIDSIRISTRPDTILNDRLDILEPYPVSTVELGVQSMDDHVLLLAKRGHTMLQTETAVALLKERHYEIGLQMMVGLPGDDETTSLNTARRIAELAPNFVRIYPTLVLRDSLLARWYAAGKYTPLTLDACVTQVKKLYLFFRERSVPVIRMGLQASEGFENDGAILAGPFHPAFGQMVHSEIFLDMATAALESENAIKDNISITVHPHSISKMRGLKNRNIQILKQRFSIESIEVAADAAISEDQLSIHP